MLAVKNLFFLIFLYFLFFHDVIEVAFEVRMLGTVLHRLVVEVAELLTSLVGRVLTSLGRALHH